ncbi:MAG: histidinol-phosphate transaminase [Candidatus Devosia phytovorans]|uniref:Histidinol-phosphate aminotransferase n=1 Tax=Candidatus Devosia phytovorans TaxID=3121372 RepID=A0AAJ5VWY6_9HYPH|nr:histidinol-phosphate transaminase [Devosia sp.]WEK04924.1 MAG: histidinol-phosphate transaminase [Devosia sp.]
MARDLDMVRPEVRELTPYNSGLTIDEVQARYAPEKISKLGSNENPLGPSPAVIAALVTYIAAPHIYPDPAGRALRTRLAEKHGVAVEQIILGNGSEDLLSVICRTALRPGDRMVTLYPSFPLHEDYCTVMGAMVDRVSLTEDLHIDVDDLVTRSASAPRLVMFANPMNPAGAWLRPDELRRVVDATPAETLLVIDEAYAEYAQGEDYLEAPDALRTRTGNWIVLRTFSKAWGLAGLRIGYGIVSTSALTNYLDRVRTPFNTNGAAQAAALAALGDEAHVHEVANQTIAERDRVARTLREAGYRVLPSKGNFLFFDSGASATAISEALLQQGVIVKPWKQSGYERFIRVTIGTASENDHFLTALATTRS